MTDITSHDQNFKNLIVDYPRDALAFFAAEEAPAPDDDVEITPLRQEQLKDRLGDRFRELDVPLLVEWRDGRREAVLFVVEEETRPRRFSTHRLAHYCLDLAQMFDTERVVPVAIFLRGAKAAPAPLALGTELETYLRFNYLACRLAETPYEDWHDSGNVAALVNLPNMRVPPERRVEAYAAAVRGLEEVEKDADRKAKYMEFIEIYARLSEDESRRFERDHAEEKAVMTGFIQRAREEGLEQGKAVMTGFIQKAREEGRQEGMERGVLRGERAVLERQLRHRFGPLPAAVVERLGQASADDLETWADNVLDAGTLDGVFGPGR